MNIVIPTYKRWNGLEGLEYFGKVAKWVLPESQRDEYLKVLKQKQMIVIPDEMDGSTSKKRNWILENIPKPLVMMDDDVKRIEYLDNRIVDKTDYKVLRNFTDFVKMGFDLMEGFETVLWGIYQKPDSREYKEYLPFSLTNLVLGPFLGFGKEFDFKFDKMLPFKEDYDINLQVLRKYKKVLRLNKFAYRCKHAENEGGVVGQRTLERESENCQRIMEKWGTRIIKYSLPAKKRTDLLNAKINIPIKGI